VFRVSKSLELVSKKIDTQKIPQASASTPFPLFKTLQAETAKTKEAKHSTVETIPHPFDIHHKSSSRKSILPSMHCA
jgi:hypothetical protein